MAKGRKTGGRKAGTPNQVTTTFKEGVLLAFEGIGGIDAFTKWARRNRGIFYTKIAVKLIPHDVSLTGTIALAEKRDALSAIPQHVLDQLADSDESVH